MSDTTPEEYQRERAELERWLKGNKDAIAFIEALATISQTWDDLIDRDWPVPDEEINRAFQVCLIDLPRNYFYTKHFAELQPLVEQAILDWLDANKLERGSDHDKMLAYVFRDTMANILIRCALLVGGWDWAREVSLEIRRSIYDEPLSDYLKEHSHGQ